MSERDSPYFRVRHAMHDVEKPGRCMRAADLGLASAQTARHHPGTMVSVDPNVSRNLAGERVPSARQQKVATSSESVVPRQRHCQVGD